MFRQSGCSSVATGQPHLACSTAHVGPKGPIMSQHKSPLAPRQASLSMILPQTTLLESAGLKHGHFQLAVPSTAAARAPIHNSQVGLSFACFSANEMAHTFHCWYSANKQNFQLAALATGLGPQHRFPARTAGSAVLRYQLTPVGRQLNMPVICTEPFDIYRLYMILSNA